MLAATAAKPRPRTMRNPNDLRRRTFSMLARRASCSFSLIPCHFSMAGNCGADPIISPSERSRRIGDILRDCQPPILHRHTTTSRTRPDRVLFARASPRIREPTSRRIRVLPLQNPRLRDVGTLRTLAVPASALDFASRKEHHSNVTLVAVGELSISGAQRSAPTLLPQDTGDGRRVDQQTCGRGMTPPQSQYCPRRRARARFAGRARAR
jgi:hypothetical protein